MVLTTLPSTVVTQKDLLAVVGDELVDVTIVTELERLLIDRIPFDGDGGYLRLKTHQVSREKEHWC